MNRKVQEPFTLPVYGDLQHQINEMIIAIKLHYTMKDLVEPAVLAKAMSNRCKPTWEQAVVLLQRIYQELNEKRYNPVKY